MRLIALIIALLARSVSAQPPDAIRAAPGATISGVVHDSLARAPLADAMVQLVPSDNLERGGRAAATDSLGRFAFDSVADGRYLIGFLHPMLDSLGLEPMLREIVVSGQRPVRIDLAIPSAARLRVVLCGAGTAPEATAVVLGIVRDARDRAPAAGVTVTAQWLELALSRAGTIPRTPRIATTTAANGWFALCNVPRGGTIAIAAFRGAYSTDRIEAQVPAEGLLRREMYLGASRSVATQTGDAVSPVTTRVRTGDGRLTGTVVTAVGARPIAGATVGIVDGPQT